MPTPTRLLLPLVALCPLIVALAGCSDDSASGAGPTTPPANTDPGPYRAPPASAVVETGAVTIRREVFTVDGVEAPANPLTQETTPAELQRVRVVRYRVEAPSPKPARAIVVMMPGFLGGAGSFDEVARAVVRRSTEEAPLEAWAIDRRSNLLEDHHGLDVAEHFRDPAQAARYYFADEPAAVEGRTFAGFPAQKSVGYMAEWGLATTLGDLRRVIERVPLAERRGRVVLLGHSLGASLAEAYAAWDFDGTPGYQELASLVLVDGVGGDEGASEPATTQELYEQGGAPAPGGFGTTPGLTGIRKSSRYFALPLLGTAVYPVASVTAMRAAWAPGAVEADLDRDRLLSTLLSLSVVPAMTNRAALGLAFDASSNGLSFAAVNCGQASGGPMEPYASLFGPTLLHPTGAGDTYDWVEHDATSPREPTSLDDLARSWYEGPGLDFAEWYFPQRLSADTPLATSLTLAATGWPAAVHGLRAFHGAALDLPIYGHAAGLMAGDVARFEPLRTLVAAVPIGPDRPAAGTPRSDPRAFATLASPALSHIDPLLGADEPGSQVASWYDALAAWALTHSPAGGVVVAPP